MDFNGPAADSPAIERESVLNDSRCDPVTAGATRWPTAISLFSGAGGMDIGFMRAGFDVLAAIELDTSCCDTLKANLKDTLVMNADISTLDGNALMAKLNLKKGELDMLFGGPPCQSFSLAGNRRGLDDPRGELVGHFARLVHELAPTAFVMENVKGMANWSNGKAIDLVLAQLAEPVIINGIRSSYKCTVKVLNAVNFGVAQNRERLFIVGNRVGKDFIFPSPTHMAPERGSSSTKPLISVNDAIGALPPASPPSVTAQRVSKTIKGRIERHGY